MTQPATHLRDLPTLSQLLRRELTLDALNDSVGPELANLEKHWERALLRPLCSLAERNGKELRARLLTIAWRLAGGRGPIPSELIGLIEGLHLGSLIVDDIEDGSRTRRGGPTLHVAVGVPLALNAGNWLYFWPTLMIRRLTLTAYQELDLRRAIDTAVLNAHFGQALDLSLRVPDLRQGEVTNAVRAVSELKTGCLMELAARASAIVTGSDQSIVDTLGRLGRELGVGLQMLDDLTSVNNHARIHKGREDVRQGRPTWPWAWLAQSTDEVGYGRLRALQQRVLEGNGDADRVVAALGARVAEIGRTSVNEQLLRALTGLEHEFDNTSELQALGRWINELSQYTG